MTDLTTSKVKLLCPVMTVDGYYCVLLEGHDGQHRNRNRHPDDPWVEVGEQETQDPL